MVKQFELFLQRLGSMQVEKCVNHARYAGNVLMVFTVAAFLVVMFKTGDFRSSTAFWTYILIILAPLAGFMSTRFVDYGEELIAKTPGDLDSPTLLNGTAAVIFFTAMLTLLLCIFMAFADLPQAIAILFFALVQIIAASHLMQPANLNLSIEAKTTAEETIISYGLALAKVVFVKLCSVWYMLLMLTAFLLALDALIAREEFWLWPSFRFFVAATLLPLVFTLWYLLANLLTMVIRGLIRRK